MVHGLHIAINEPKLLVEKRSLYLLFIDRAKEHANPMSDCTPSKHYLGNPHDCLVTFGLSYYKEKGQLPEIWEYKDHLKASGATYSYAYISKLTNDAARDVNRKIWETTNEKNLKELENWKEYFTIQGWEVKLDYDGKFVFRWWNQEECPLSKDPTCRRSTSSYFVKVSSIVEMMKKLSSISAMVKTLNYLQDQI